MTLAAACGLSLVRSLAVALAAWPICKCQVAWLSGMQFRRRRLAWMALVIPFLCPELWAGYAWSGFAVRLADTGLWRLFPFSLFPLSPEAMIARDAAIDELLLNLLLFFRAVPVGTVAMVFAPPPPLSREAWHCRKLVLGNDGGNCGAGVSPANGQARRLHHKLLGRNWLQFALYGRFYSSVPALALMFLVAFQEFELASLIGRPAWTVWLFDAQAGGLGIAESLRLTTLPVLCQCFVLAPLVWMILASRANTATKPEQLRQTSWLMRVVLWLLVIAGLTITCIVPAMLVGGDSAAGLRRVLQNSLQFRMLLKEVFIGTAYALTAALASVLIAASLIRMGRRSRLSAAAVIGAAIPGLAGSLVLGLALIHLMQSPFARFAYKTPLSLAGGLFLFLLPRAMALRLLLSSTGNSAGLYLAKLLRESAAAAVRDRAREVAWQMRWRGEFWSVALLAYWAFFDLTLASLLAPVTIVSAPVMLYNQMHFGKNAVLSALVFLTVLVPALIFITAAAARRFLWRWF